MSFQFKRKSFESLLIKVLIKNLTRYNIKKKTNNVLKNIIGSNMVRAFRDYMESFVLPIAQEVQDEVMVLTDDLLDELERSNQKQGDQATVGDEDSEPIEDNTDDDSDSDESDNDADPLELSDDDELYRVHTSK